ncbi:ClbS/DfsB family four-helix bundle protein [Candidatus Enterococcus ferrettii]|uniref:ClbS/DfsB family four-helix bundle protein n=1 Tax=Candidatus Enterococcus ferrettii TaxID=2815324 RepID=A0ABV0EQE6_9ENTE|nr:ClbS/DfsB family four-helix bundle protein [Enterococcus sp. 665A]MBO1339291.1 ClbS/DfsB family four-helix bundle protein [Enterococcus sp. 665A]
MPRPTTKHDLIQTGNETFNKLMDLLNSLPEDQVTTAFTFNTDKEKGAHWERDKNLRDVLVHLYEWHQLLIHWVNSNLAGEERPFLKEGYNWKNYAAMNVEFWENHQETSYEDAMALLKESHSVVIKLAEQLSNDELFSKGIFSWVGGSTLGSYFVSATSSHYEWALKKTRKFKKSLKF